MPDEKFNYSDLGLKCGLEVHQQLEAGGKKLFCNCPSVLRSDESDFFVSRKLHAVAGESGKVDVAAQYQASLNKEFVYEGYDITCLIELDESPPREINEEALKTALQVALLLNCEIFPISQIMRKTVIDGSNTSGFQRTVLIAKNGYVETEYGRVGIDTICLEEDSARIISSNDREATYRLDRLGIPLIEIATSSDIKNPEQAKEVALYIGEILRACKVKRGIGTIRQDVNMSVLEFGGTRIEIKGVQKPELIIKTINSEIERQKSLFENKEKINSEVRKALPNGETEFLRPMPGAARMYPETDLPLLKVGKRFIDEVKKSLPKVSGELKEELKDYGLHEELIKLILQSGKIDEFKELVSVRKNPELVAKMLVLYPRELASKKKIDIEKTESVLHKDVLVSMLEALNNGEINENQIREVMERILDGKSIKEALKFEKQDMNVVEERVMKLIKENPGLSANAYMGLLMKEPEFRGKVNPKELMEIIKKYV